MQFPRLFGVQMGNLKQEVRIWGPICLVDALIIIITLMVCVYCNRFFWDCKSVVPRILFSIDVGSLGLYSIIRPRTNPGKRNIELFMLTFTPTTRFFQSIDSNIETYNYIRMNNVFDTGKNAIHRLRVSRADIRGDK